MALYWANAITKEGERLFTYVGCLKPSEAIEVLGKWRECGFEIKEAWVSTHENGKETRIWEYTDME